MLCIGVSLLEASGERSCLIGPLLLYASQTVCFVINSNVSGCEMKLSAMSPAVSINRSVIAASGLRVIK